MKSETPLDVAVGILRHKDAEIERLQEENRKLWRENNAMRAGGDRGKLWDALEDAKKVAEGLREKNELLKQAAAASLPDDGELITEDWWREQTGVSRYGSLELHEGTAIVMLGAMTSKDGFLALEVWEDEDCISFYLPAVRTRGDVRALVRLLGRE